MEALFFLPRPGSRLLEQTGTVEDPQQRNALRDTPVVAVAASRNGRRIGQVGMHAHGLVEEPGAHQHRSVGGELLEVAEEVRQAEGVDRLAGSVQPYLIPVANFGIDFVDATHVGKAI